MTTISKEEVQDNVFPMTFDSPSQAVRAIYEMKQSNPGALIRFETRRTWKQKSSSMKQRAKCTAYEIEESDLGFTISTGSYAIRYENLSWEVFIWWEKTESITITSIQSVEQKLKRWDRVLIISLNIVWLIDYVWQWWSYYSIADALTQETQRPLEEPDDENEVFWDFPNRDLIKLPEREVT